MWELAGRRGTSSYTSASTSASLDSFLGGETHNFIPEEFVPSVILHGLGCCSFPLTLITRHGSTKDALHPIHVSYHHCGEAIQYSPGNLD